MLFHKNVKSQNVEISALFVAVSPVPRTVQAGPGPPQTHAAVDRQNYSNIGSGPVLSTDLCQTTCLEAHTALLDLQHPESAGMISFHRSENPGSTEMTPASGLHPVSGRHRIHRCTTPQTPFSGTLFGGVVWQLLEKCRARDGSRFWGLEARGLAASRRQDLVCRLEVERMAVAPRGRAFPWLRARRCADPVPGAARPPGTGRRDPSRCRSRVRAAGARGRCRAGGGAWPRTTIPSGHRAEQDVSGPSSLPASGLLTLSSGLGSPREARGVRTVSADLGGRGGGGAGGRAARPRRARNRRTGGRRVFSARRGAPSGSGRRDPERDVGQEERRPGEGAGGTPRARAGTRGVGWRSGGSRPAAGRGRTGSLAAGPALWPVGKGLRPWGAALAEGTLPGSSWRPHVRGSPAGSAFLSADEAAGGRAVGSACGQPGGGRSPASGLQIAAEQIRRGGARPDLTVQHLQCWLEVRARGAGGAFSGFSDFAAGTRDQQSERMFSWTRFHLRYRSHRPLC